MINRIATSLDLPAVPRRQNSRLARLAARVEPSRWPYWLLATDVALIWLAFGLAYFTRYELQLFRPLDPTARHSLLDYAPFILALTVLLPLAFRFSRVYPYRRGRSLIEEIYHIGTATTLGMMVLIVTTLVFREQLYSRLIFLYAAVLIIGLLTLSRLVIKLALGYLRRFDVGVERLLLVGAGDVGRMVMRNVVARPELGLRLIGFVDDNPHKNRTDIGRFKALGSIDNFVRVLDKTRVDRVIICLPWQSHRTVQRLLRLCERRGLRAQVVPDFFQLTMNQLEVESLNGIPLIGSRESSIQGWNLVLKRAMDVVLALLIGGVLLPLLGLIALAIRLDSRGPILYEQVRAGKHGRPFRCFKFRSMVQDAEGRLGEVAAFNEATGPLFKMRDDPRRTRVGCWLRRFSLDELPQLYNVLRGEMSLVGPRPNLLAEVEAYSEWHRKRLAVSPGLTGLWQVSGRSDLTFDEMVLLDIYYIENWSPMLDVGLLLRSLPAVARGRGAY